MWNLVATEAERDECETLRRDRSPVNTFTADASKIPEDPKQTDDPAPADTLAAPAGPAGPTPGVTVPKGDHGATAPADIGPVPDTDVGAARAPPAADDTAQGPVIPTGAQVAVAQGSIHVNTTTFNYMPAPSQLHSQLPDIVERKLNPKNKRTLLDAGLADPEREQEGKRWRGTYFLGSGATGNCSLWVQTDEYDNIDRRFAVRDVATLALRHWVDPVNWRDRLPREIAIMRRLEKQGGHHHNIHRYFGHRIDMYKRRYRIYTEVCDLNNVASALEWYSRQWRRRRHMFKWQQWVDIQPEILEAKRNRGGYSPGTVVDDVRETKTEILEKIQSAEGSVYRGKDFSEMSGIEDWYQDDLPNDVPLVIPEAFLWHVFDQLVDAALILHRGAEPLIGENKWKEIVHKDMHTGNIFMKPKAEGVFGVELEQERKDSQRKRFATMKKSEVSRPRSFDQST